MNGLELALVILVTVWSVIFIIVAIAIMMVFFAVRRAINKANRILDRTEEVANKMDLPSKVVIGSVLGFIAKNSRLTSFITEKFFKRGKK